MSTNEPDIIAISTIACPKCETSFSQKMPIDSCQYFLECPGCKTVLKPTKGDCCVFCSYGTVPCPPVQEQAKY